MQYFIEELYLCHNVAECETVLLGLSVSQVIALPNWNVRSLPRPDCIP